MENIKKEEFEAKVMENETTKDKVIKRQEKINALAVKREEILEDEENLALKLEKLHGSRTIKKELEYAKEMQELKVSKGLISVKKDGSEIYKSKEYLWEEKSAAYNKIFSFLKRQGIPEKDQTKFAKILNEYVGLELEFGRVD